MQHDQLYNDIFLKFDMKTVTTIRIQMLPTNANDTKRTPQRTIISQDIELH